MSDKSNSSAAGGITIGMILAIVLSWTTNHSILLCILHAFLSWIYVIYWAFAYGPLSINH